MLELTVKSKSFYDEETETFIDTPEYSVQLEHSLFALSKWEEKWGVPFLSDKEKTDEQTYDYIRCMVVSGELPDNFEFLLTYSDVQRVIEYINASMTATTFNNQNQRPSREVVTAELIFYWMISMNIPFECQHWHLSKLFTLIQVCGLKNNPKKMSKKDAINQQRELNEQRRNMFKTSG